MPTPRLVLLLTAALVLPLAACGQKGPLYQTDEGIAVVPAAPAPSGPMGAPGPAPDAESGAIVPASPDRSDEPRKRIHTP